MDALLIPTVSRRERKNVVKRIGFAFFCLMGITLLFENATSIARARERLNIAAGKLVVEPPTLISLGFEWYMDGDDNRNASVQTYYRKKNEPNWHDGLPLLRIHGERTVLLNSLDYTAPNMFAGSIFNLDPDTEYECRFVLADPDGVSGKPQEIVTVRTRREPQPYAGGRTFHVYPAGYQGSKQEPSFIGLLAAYYTAAIGGDWNNASPPRVQPGDTILMHAGWYKDDRSDYSHEIFADYKACCGTTWDGTYYLTQSGTAGKPIAIKAAGDGEVIFDGDGNHVLFNIMAANYLYFEGITFRNTDTAIEAGQKNIAGSQDLTIKRSRFENVGIGIHTDYSGSKNYYIADNVLIGRHDPDHLFGWMAIAPWKDLPRFEELRRMKSYFGIKVYGSGHVIAYNRVSGFHDGIDHATYGMPDQYPKTPLDRMPVSIDIYNNDVTNAHDNCFEADGAMHNIRVFRNRCFNVATGAMSPQPVFGGPVYFIQNVVYNGIYGPLKIHGDPSGILVYQNTYVGEVAQLTPASNMHFRNNLILGQDARPMVFAIDTYTNYSSSDYNGFMANKNSEFSFQWNSPALDKGADYASPRVERRFKTLRQYVEATSQDRHSREVDYTIFRNASAPNLNDPTRLISPGEVDLRLREGSAAVDGGVILPNITDGFTGKAPDLGAYEFGKDLPHYGPRP
jgi:hypothetical protein